ncbi:hypothetical protein EJ110_NYTH40720 [Nymphaea thermarum]|nr:hypothetical protein EJ110_NYTH40720 [Nymphaea thermarum]
MMTISAEWPASVALSARSCHSSNCCFNRWLPIPLSRAAAAAAAASSLFLLRRRRAVPPPCSFNSVLGGRGGGDSMTTETIEEGVGRDGEEGEDGEGGEGGNLEIGDKEWEEWGITSSWSTQVPEMVLESVEGLKALRREVDAPIKFGGIGGKLRGAFKEREEKKHKAMYQSLLDSEKKLQFFAARQIGCRLLGSRGYLCHKCWLPLHGDCMCSKILPCFLWHGLRFWLYMHPKDFLRQNNTGKLLWQLFGVEQARLCLFGICEHEESMWKVLQNAGRDMVWCLYPTQNAPSQSVKDINFDGVLGSVEEKFPQVDEKMPVMNVILVDGTWNNSAAMFNRLKDRAIKVWGEGLNTISLAIPSVSVMHKLRTQPSKDRSCTAAAAADLLTEMNQLPQLSSLGLHKSAEALNDTLESLLDALTGRRIRTGRSIARTVRASSCHKF